MENMTIRDVAMAALLNETVPALNSPTVHGAASTVRIFILCVLAVSAALFILLYSGLPLLGFVSGGIVFGSIAAGWMSSIGIVAAGSVFALLQSIAAGGVSVVVVLLCIVAVVVLAVGAFEIIVGLVHLWSSGALHIPAWLVSSWDSVSAWVVHAWNSGDMLGWWHSVLAWLLQLWHFVTAWVIHLWDSIPVHHKWKILYT